MYNDLALKYFDSQKRSEIWKEAKNLCKDIAFFEEYMNRFKKTSFDLKVSFYDDSSEKSIQVLFEKHSYSKLDESTIAEILLKYNLAKFFINEINDENITDEMEKDIYEFSVYWSTFYGGNGLVDYVSDFVDCSGSINAVTREINTIIKNNRQQRFSKRIKVLPTSEDASLIYLKNFIEKEIDFDNMLVNSGIYETKAIAKHIGFDGVEDVTIGVCFENSEAIGGPYECNDGTVLEEFYTYNIFVGNEYVNIFGGAIGSVEDRLPESTLALIRKEILKFANIEI